MEQPQQSQLPLEDQPWFQEYERLRKKELASGVMALTPLESTIYLRIQTLAPLFRVVDQRQGEAQVLRGVLRPIFGAWNYDYTATMEGDSVRLRCQEGHGTRIDRENMLRAINIFGNLVIENPADPQMLYRLIRALDNLASDDLKFWVGCLGRDPISGKKCRAEIANPDQSVTFCPGCAARRARQVLIEKLAAAEQTIEQLRGAMAAKGAGVTSDGGSTTCANS